MKTKFELSTLEIQDAVQAFIAKSQRSRNLKVTEVTFDANTQTVLVGAEVESKPVVARKPRTKKPEAKKQA